MTALIRASVSQNIRGRVLLPAERKLGGIVLFNVTWQLILLMCAHGSFVFSAAEVLSFVLNSLHGEAGFIAAIKKH